MIYNTETSSWIGKPSVLALTAAFSFGLSKDRGKMAITMDTSAQSKRTVSYSKVPDTVKKIHTFPF